MYDMDNDGVISKNELLAFMTLMVGEDVSQVSWLQKDFFE